MRASLTVLALSCALAGCKGGEASGAGSGTYEVYAGCEAPSSSYVRTVYVDPASGTDDGDGSEASPWKTLSAALAAKQIVAGDHVVLRAGDHGAVTVSKYNNAALVDAATWTWLDGQDGATFTQLDVRDMSRWLITKIAVTNSTGTMLSLSGGANFVVADSELFTARESAGFTADDWINHVASGIGVRNTKCAALLRNRVLNVRFGISVSADAPAVEDNRLNVLVKDNEVRNFSGDGMRPIASNVTLAKNRIIDSYVNADDGDDNHDDGIQGFALNGAIYDNVLIDEIWVQETTDPSRPWNASLQGISVFDGLYTNIRVTKSVVLTSAYHGIALYGPKDAVIEHNTVVGIDPTRKLWITAPPSKTNVVPVNTMVRNNIASTYVLDPAVTSENNPTVTTPEATANFVKFDLEKAEFDLHLQPSSALAKSGAGAY